MDGERIAARIRTVRGANKETGEMNMDRKALELARRIVELDLQRDAMFEQLIQLIGERAYEVLRFVQNRI
jgi:hypothetical protein